MLALRRQHRLNCPTDDDGVRHLGARGGEFQVVLIDFETVRAAAFVLIQLGHIGIWPVGNQRTIWLRPSSGCGSCVTPLLKRTVRRMTTKG